MKVNQLMSDKPNILFLCTGNSCRSQMAEGFTRHLKSDVLEAFSAGVETHGLNEYAVMVMKEVGVDISSQKSKNVDDLGDMTFEYVVTVCDNARESCPFFPAKTRLIHKAFDDPQDQTKDNYDEQDNIQPVKYHNDLLFLSSSTIQ